MALNVGRTEVSPGPRPPELQKYDYEMSVAERAARLEEIHQYLRDREDQLPVVATTTTPLGQELNWVEAESQVEGGKLAEMPSADEPLTAVLGEHELLPVLFELMQEGAELGPPGTVPVLKHNLSSIHPQGTLQDFLAKGPHPASKPFPGEESIVVHGGGSQHEYALARHTGTCYGSQALINAWDPYIEYSDEMSLGQVAMPAVGAKGLQTVEAGHIKYPDKCGDWLTHLFTYYTTNSYTLNGDRLGGYNQDVKGWVQLSRLIHPGAISSPLSSFGGLQYVMDVKYQLWRGAWCLRVNGHWIGYYPASLFDDPGLQRSAENADWYGEIADPGTHHDSPAASMGSGEFPRGGWQYAAFMCNIRYQSDAEGNMHDYAPATEWASRPNCYDVESHFASDASWDSYFWWGGPGRSRQCQ